MITVQVNFYKILGNILLKLIYFFKFYIQWSQPINDSARGHIFYRRFSCGNDSITRVYSATDFILFTPPLTAKVYVAEILSAWKTTHRNFVSLRIYAKPQDTECGRLSSHGEVSKNLMLLNLSVKLFVI